MTNKEPSLAELDNAINTRLPLLNKLGRYYEGTQPLAYLSPDAKKALGNFDRFAVNLPRLAVTAVAERLRVQSFLTADGVRDATLAAAWLRNDLDQLAPVAHREALAVGEAAVIVWADASGKRAQVSVESPEQVAVYRDAGSRETLAAIKRWTDKAPDGTDRQTRWVIYRPDRIEHLVGDGSSITAAKVIRTVDNPLLAVPVVPLVNTDRPLDMFGTSEFVDLIPITDALNKLTTDLLTASEFGARPRRWATGLELEKREVLDEAGNPVLDENDEPVTETVNPIEENDRLMVNEAAEGKFGSLPGADLVGYENAVAVLLQQAMAVSGLPAHYVGVTSSVPASADAIRAAEAALTARAEARQASLGRAWEQVGRLVLAIENGGEVTDYSPRVQWGDAATRSIAQESDAAVKLHAAGIIDTAEARDRLGITDPDKTPKITPATTNGAAA